MKVFRKSILIIYGLLFISCKSQTENVELYYKYSIDTPIEVFNKKTNKPFSGKFISTSNIDKVVIEFEDGKMNGKYLRAFLDGDTIEYSKYKNGIKLSSLDYIYDNGKLDYKELIENRDGDETDRKLFIKACNLIVNNNTNEVYDLLNNEYSDTFEKLKYLFGKLKGFELKNVVKKYYKYNQSEHIVGDINLIFDKKQLNSTFLIIRYPDKIKGQGFGFPKLEYKLEKNQIEKEIIESINKKDIDKFISLTQYDESYKNVFDEKFKEINKISTDSKFLNTHFDYYNRLLLVQDYLVLVDNEKQVLSLIYEIGKNSLDLVSIKFSNYYKDFNVLHRINGK